MISVEARGRLGNHLFQFAFGLAASTRLGTDFAINDEMLRPNFTLDPWGRRAHRLARGARYRLANRERGFPVVKIDPDVEPRDVLAGLSDGTHYAGFFQSEQYFADVDDGVRRAFHPLPRHERAFAARYGALRRTQYICCHVRQTDYRDWGGGCALPASYYRDALERLAPDSQTPIVVVGDDPGWLAGELGTHGLRVEQNDEIVDLQLLANASLLVLSNSSFAWWGGWLNERAARILAPRHWIGFKHGRETPHRIVAAGWEQIPVDASVSV